jgi:hypothetical protein
MLKPRFKNMTEMLKEFNDSLRDMDRDRPKDRTLLSEKKTERAPVIVEDAPAPKTFVQAEAAPLSKYSSSSAAMSSFRVLAGLEEREMSPWNPGILGETRTVKKMQEDFGMSKSKKDSK